MTTGFLVSCTNVPTLILGTYETIQRPTQQDSQGKVPGLGILSFHIYALSHLPKLHDWKRLLQNKSSEIS